MLSSIDQSSFRLYFSFSISNISIVLFSQMTRVMIKNRTITKKNSLIKRKDEATIFFIIYIHRLCLCVRMYLHHRCIAITMLCTSKEKATKNVTNEEKRKREVLTTICACVCFLSAICVFFFVFRFWCGAITFSAYLNTNEALRLKVPSCISLLHLRRLLWLFFRKSRNNEARQQVSACRARQDKRATTDDETFLVPNDERHFIFIYSLIEGGSEQRV